MSKLFPKKCKIVLQIVKLVLKICKIVLHYLQNGLARFPNYLWRFAKNENDSDQKPLEYVQTPSV